MNVGLGFKLRKSGFYSFYTALNPHLSYTSHCVDISFHRLITTTCTVPFVFLCRSIDEMKRLEEMSHVFQRSGVERHPSEPKSQTEGNEDLGGKEQPWEMVMDKKHFKLWRRPITGTHLYQYRGEPSLAALCVPWLPRCAGLLFLILSKLFFSDS